MPDASPKLAQRAYEAIRSRILKSQLPLGSAVSRRGLALELGMSHLPVAEAMQRLEDEGLLVSRPRSGTTVRVPTSEEVRQSYELREALESQAARVFARNAGTRQQVELNAMAERLDSLFNRCFSGGSNDAEFLYTVQEFHARFHLQIAAGGGCCALAEALEKNQVLTFNWLQDVAAGRPQLPPRFHRDLAAAICGGDEEAADRAMRIHVRHGLDYVAAKIGELGLKARQPGIRAKTRG